MPLSPHTLARASLVTLALAACAHTQPTPTVTRPPTTLVPAPTQEDSDAAVPDAAVPDAPAPDASDPAPAPAPPADPHAPVSVGFLSDAAMSHLRLGLVVWRGGRADPQVLDGGRYISPCSEEIYRRVMHHPATAPVVIGIACDGRALAPDDPTALRVIEVVREHDAVVVRVSPVRRGHPVHFETVARSEVPAGVPVTQASAAQITQAEHDIQTW